MRVTRFPLASSDPGGGFILLQRRRRFAHLTDGRWFVQHHRRLHRARRQRRHRLRRQHRVCAVRSRLRERHRLRADAAAPLSIRRPRRHLPESLGARRGAVARDREYAIQLGRSDPGNFVERYPPFVPPAAAHLTIFVGGNDAPISSAPRCPRGPAAGHSRLRGCARSVSGVTILLELVSRICRARAPNARIVAYRTFPNLAAAPYLASRRTTQEKSIMQRIATGLTNKVNALTSRNVLVVDLMCDPRILQPGSFSAIK